jgi:hypothetical protein
MGEQNPLADGRRSPIAQRPNDRERTVGLPNKPVERRRARLERFDNPRVSRHGRSRESHKRPQSILQVDDRADRHGSRLATIADTESTRVDGGKHFAPRGQRQRSQNQSAGAVSSRAEPDDRRRYRAQ